MYLRPLIYISDDGLVVSLWIYRSNAGCSNLHRPASFNFIHKSVLGFLFREI